MWWRNAVIELLLAASLLWLNSLPSADPNVALLRAKDQALLDAFAPGDRKVWGQALAADAVYVNRRESWDLVWKAEPRR
jgi:hypothetical protein